MKVLSRMSYLKMMHIDSVWLCFLKNKSFNEIYSIEDNLFI